MPVPTGHRFGPYEVIGPLGAGGMGEVYRARDTRLDRDVAVKVLPPLAAADPEFRARFDREAKVISQLNHPNICVLHDVGDGFIVMELLEGDTLAARLLKGALPIDDVLRIATEIADALDKAHRRGIIHRDLKPANVMLTSSGSKLLDFGLAKPGVVSTSNIETRLATSESTMGSQLPRTNMDAAPLTARGTILGTFQYMAPEQIEGDPTDARTDIWAFGCLLYEMVTGRRAFEGKSQASLIASILEKQPPPVAELQPMTPPALGRIIRTCLEKNPDDRFQTAHDLALQLEWIEEGGSAAGLPAPVIAGRKRRERLIGASAAVLLAAAAAVAGWMAKPAPPAPAGVVARFTDLLPADHAFSRTGRRVLALSPDGSKFAYVANNQLYLRRFDELAPAAITGTASNPSEPVFSPDGESLVYWSGGANTNLGNEGKLWRIPAAGGTPTPLCDSANPAGMSWSASGRIVFGLNEGLMAVPPTGGTPEMILKPDEAKGERLAQPQLVDDGRAVVFVSGVTETRTIEVADLATRERRVLVRDATSPRVLASGHLVFYRDNTVFAQRFDARARTVEGSPVSVVQRVRPAALSWTAQFAVSETGTLAYIEGDGDELLTLTWLDRAGKPAAVPAPLRRYYEPRISRDGTRVVTATRDDANDIFIWEFSRGIETRVTRSDLREFSPIWTPDDREILFAAEDTSRTGKRFQLMKRRADLTTDAVSVSPYLEIPEAPRTIGGGNAWIVERAIFAKDHLGIRQPALDGEAPPLIGTSMSSRNGVLSPDGRWLAYEAREGEVFETFVRPFPNVNDSRVQVSQGGGIWPAWSRDGKELYFVAGTLGIGTMMTVAVKAPRGNEFDFGPPVRLFSIAGYIRSVNRGYDVAPDGRFLLVANPAAITATDRFPIQFIVNWFDDVRARVK